jgi:hypothetical protein
MSTGLKGWLTNGRDAKRERAHIYAYLTAICFVIVRRHQIPRFEDGSVSLFADIVVHGAARGEWICLAEPRARGGSAWSCSSKLHLTLEHLESGLSVSQLSS